MGADHTITLSWREDEGTRWGCDECGAAKWFIPYQPEDAQFEVVQHWIERHSAALPMERAS